MKLPRFSAFLSSRPSRLRVRPSRLFPGLFLAGLLLLAFSAATTLAQETPPADEAIPAASQPSPLHPTFAMLDSAGENVLESGQPMSTMQTCGVCHDTAFIAEHSFHADVGLSDLTAPGEAAGASPWDISPGLFGRWNPIMYRYLSPAGDERLDMTTAEWIQTFGVRHVGGGPAETSRAGDPLTALPADADPTDAAIIDPANGDLVPWDWAESGVAEMNCFLCHTPDPNNDARKAALHAGDFQWASTATLLGSGIVEQAEPGVPAAGFRWNPAAFDNNGELLAENVALQNPTSENCAQCHGLVHVQADTPLTLSGCSPEQWSTITTGQIISPQRIADSGLNIAGKQDLGRTWDVHAERVLACTDCHYSLNNPVYFQEDESSRPDHLTFDPRRIDHGEYLYRPLHEFAKGQSAQGLVAPELDNTLRRCESCHDGGSSHDWLPYQDRHFAALACESCHIPQMYAPSRQYFDWTVLTTDGSAQVACRGIEDEGDTFSNVLINSYAPILLPRENSDGSSSLAPHNLITAWYWVYQDNASGQERPVPLRDLQAAWLEDGAYPAAIITLFDADKNGRLEEGELVIDTGEKEALIASRLEQLGLDNPRIAGEVQPYSINHNVTTGEWATRDCETCHAGESLVTRPALLADRLPGGVMPEFVGDSAAGDAGSLFTTEAGDLYYQLETNDSHLYVLGHDSENHVDQLGALLFAGAIVGVALHGGLRVISARRRPAGHQPQTQQVYMYTFYERLWHWLQTLVILLLLFTGLIIHKPDTFGIFSFRYVVQVHNILALILVVNAGLAAFYHLASGEIRQFLPRPRGFFDQAFLQAKYYLRGIFRGDEHPFEKSPQQKMNPLQQVTYIAILNVLLPLQIITGILMWGAQRWPDIVAGLGGLPYVAPVHTLASWLFASFIVMHVYLTTTGPEPLSSIKGMVAGWDEVELHPAADFPGNFRGFRENADANLTEN